MNKFSDFKIQANPSTFVGDKIALQKLINKEIKILNYKIEDSIKKPGTKYLTLQIEKDNNKHVVFTSAKILAQMITQVPQDKLPFTTTITNENEYYEFT